MRRTSLLTTTIAAAAAVLALTGCAAGPSFTGTWEGSGADKPTLEITDDAAFNGTDGCNRMVGSGKIDEQTFDFGQFATTRQFCEGVDTWLSMAGSATLEGDTLTVLDRDGAEIGTLTRQ